MRPTGHFRLTTWRTVAASTPTAPTRGRTKRRHRRVGTLHFDGLSHKSQRRSAGPFRRDRFASRRPRRRLERICGRRRFRREPRDRLVRRPPTLRALWPSLRHCSSSGIAIATASEIRLVGARRGPTSGLCSALISSGRVALLLVVQSGRLVGFARDDSIHASSTDRLGRATWWASGLAEASAMREDRFVVTRSSRVEAYDAALPWPLQLQVGRYEGVA
jgi:hypothetical protein